MNHHDSIDRAISGAASAAFSNEQKANVARLARRAWERLGMPEFAGQPEELPKELRIGKTEAFTLWRQNEQKKACGRLHLTAATQRDYDLLMAHFAGLAGQPQTSDRWARRAVADDGRRALAVLSREIGRAGDVIERAAPYVAGIARSRFKTSDLESLNARQIWTLVYDIRRAAARRRAGGGTASPATASATATPETVNGRPLPF